MHAKKSGRVGSGGLDVGGRVVCHIVLHSCPDTEPVHFPVLKLNEY